MELGAQAQLSKPVGIMAADGDYRGLQVLDACRHGRGGAGPSGRALGSTTTSTCAAFRSRPCQASTSSAVANVFSDPVQRPSAKPPGEVPKRKPDPTALIPAPSPTVSRSSATGSCRIRAPRSRAELVACLRPASGDRDAVRTGRAAVAASRARGAARGGTRSRRRGRSIRPSVRRRAPALPRPTCGRRRAGSANCASPARCRCAPASMSCRKNADRFARVTLVAHLGHRFCRACPFRKRA